MKRPFASLVLGCALLLALGGRGAEAKLADDHDNNARIKVWKGDLTGAMVDYDKAIAAEPNVGSHYAARASLKVRTGDPAGAMADLNRAIQVEPNRAASYGQRAALREKKGELEGARADRAKAKALTDERARKEYLEDLALAGKARGAAERIVRRGVEKQAQGDLAGAVADYTKALELDPARVDAYLGRARAHRAANNPKRAITDYSNALELNPTLPDAYRERADVRQASGDAAGAAADRRKAAELATDPRRP